MRICRVHGLGGALLFGALSALSTSASAQEVKQGSAIYTCTTAAGRTITRDRPITECLDREQRVLNSDGSLRTVLQPSLTSDERAAQEEADRRKAQERANKQDAIRRDRNLLARFPNEAAHNKARDAALNATRTGIQTSEQRLVDLQKERKPLLDEAEFYKGKTMPGKLKAQIESVDVSIEAQRALIINQQVEVGRVTALFDAELARLKRLWAGADPGSLGPLPQSALAGQPAPPSKP
ncbi:hypothetical protein [Methylibium sp.]|uniref:hypothetical protein n=1 Tax=Methylibium sp. TaxID=2067992 RepID=UPI003D0E70CC